MAAHPDYCHVCQSPSRREIDAALANGHAYRQVATQFAVSPSGLVRHMSWQRLCAARAEAVAAERRGALALLHEAQQAHQRTLQASTLPQMLQCLRDLSRLLVTVCERQANDMP